MAYDIDEQEKIESLKELWKKYGTLLASIFFIAAVAFGGWRAWQFYQSNQAEEAKGHFAALETAVQKQQLKQIKNSLSILQKDYAGTIYSSRAALLAAHVLAEQKDMTAAKAQFQWVIDNSSEAGMVALASLRLSGFYLDEKAYDKAMGLLTKEVPDAFKGLFADRKGDILLAQGKKAEALKQFVEARGLMTEDDPWREVVNAKVQALGGDAS